MLVLREGEEFTESLVLLWSTNSFYCNGSLVMYGLVLCKLLDHVAASHFEPITKGQERHNDKV
jgi:hypothetical protein